MQAYYVAQVEKKLDRFERLKRRIGEQAIWGRLDPEEARALRTWLEHGRMVRPSARRPAPPGGRPTLRG